ncbi:DUF3634 family protein [Nitrococcus mobilis]|uniref:DUF3634 family protein n=1 Tax=Nitrococcus mobilis TaxID=35797 RepID=UPI0012EA2576|nr:DUF3634 family protein [Nitrococcus mobilis]
MNNTLRPMLSRFQSVYRLEISSRAVYIKHGKPPQGFVSAVSEVVRLHGIDSGLIECLGRGCSARLRFSRGFPERGRQAIRNVWTPPSTPPPKGGRRARG